MISPKILWSLLFIFAGSVLLAQRPLILPAENSPAEVNILRNTHLVTLRAFEQNMNTRVEPPRALFTGGTENATIMVGYNGFPPSAQNAFQYAVNIWQTQITSAVPIRVTANWISLDPGVLGSAGATDFRRNFPGAPQQDTWYCVALAEKLAGNSLNHPDSADIVANFNSNFSNFYFGTDGNTPPGMYDFVSIVLHELCHGLGFSGSMTVSQNMGSWGYGTSAPFVYDRFVRNDAGQLLIDTNIFPNPSAALMSQLTGGNIFFHGPLAVTANGGLPPRLFAPPTWQQGSSYSHLDENSYPAGDPNSLMTPSVGMAESIHSPGSVTLAMFSDMGWTTGGGGSGTLVKFEETFSSTTCPPGWFVVDNDQSALYMDYVDFINFSGSGPVHPQAGNYFWFSNFMNADPFSGLIDEWLISPQIASIQAGDSLVFWAGAIDAGYNDSLRVYISTSGNALTDFNHMIAYFKVDGPVCTWHRYGFDLTPFSGQDIYFAVNYYIEDGGIFGNHSDNVWIDHFLILKENVSAIEASQSDRKGAPPVAFELRQNYPNPFNPETNVEFGIRNSEFVTLTIFDLAGRKMATLVNEHLPAGRYRVQWNGTTETGQAVASGVYFYRLRAGSAVQVRRMMLAR